VVRGVLLRHFQSSGTKRRTNRKEQPFDGLLQPVAEQGTGGFEPQGENCRNQDLYDRTSESNVKMGGVYK